MADRVQVTEVKLDYSLYPREREDGENIAALLGALEMGAELPPIIVWRETGQVIDGFHRVAAVRGHGGDTASIAVEFRDYGSKADAFEDAVRLNATHGKRLSRIDQEKALRRAADLGITQDRISLALKVPVARLEKRRLEAAPVKKLAGPGPNRLTAADLEAATRGEQRHQDAVVTALRDLSEEMASHGEMGPGELPNVMRLVQEGRSGEGAALRPALLRAAALFLWWAARVPERQAA